MSQPPILPPLDIKPAYLARTEEQKVQLAEEVIQLLNDAMAYDADAIAKLFLRRVGCTPKLADHPTIQVGVYQDLTQAEAAEFGKHSVSILGILNGIVGVRVDGWGYVTAVYDDDGRLQRFELTQRDAAANP